jgi:serine/threonine-protein kinase RsbT
VATLTGWPADLEGDRQVVVRSRLDADQARREARWLATELGFDRGDAESIALAVSELAMNLHRYAVGGTIVLRVVQEGARRGLEVESQDAGPGIADPILALQDGFSTGGGLGSGLPAARRLMDDFDLATGTAGTRIVVRKWLTSRSG